MNEILFLQEKMNEIETKGKCIVNKVEEAMTLVQILRKTYYEYTMIYAVCSIGEQWQFSNVFKE